MDIKDGLLGKVPVVTLLIAFVMTAAFLTAQFSGTDEGGQYEERLLRTQVFYERNPGVELNARGRHLLGAEFVDRVRADHPQQDKPKFSKRMRARTQGKFDSIVEEALRVRMLEDPALSEGIASTDVPASRYFTYALFHTGWVAFGVTLAFLLIAGLALESMWGALVHAPFVLLSIFVGGFVFANVDASGQVPLTGGGPLVASLLAAYLVRGLGGHMPLPGALLLPAWFFVDAVFVRNIWIDNVGDWPFTTLGLSMVLGGGIAGGIRLMGIDNKVVEAVESLIDGVHPAIEAADRLRALGRPADVFDTLAAACAEEPGNTELVLALWEAAIEIGRSEEVAPSIMPILQAELRAGDLETATLHWRQVMASGAAVQASSTLLVRLGEALLDASEPEQALDTLRRALDAPGTMGSALAQRVVRIARDLDPMLTSRAAAVALEDDQIDPEARQELESLASGGAAAASWQAERAAESSPVETGGAAEPAASPGAQTDIDALLDGGSTPLKAAEGFDDIDADLGQADDGPGGLGDIDDNQIDLSHAGDLASPEDFAELDTAAGMPAMGAEAAAGEVDPNALSIQSIEREFAGGLESDAAARGGSALAVDAAARGDSALAVDAAAGAPTHNDPSTWNQIGVIEDLSAELESADPLLMADADAADGPAVDNSFLDAGALSPDSLSGESDDLGIDDTPISADDLGVADGPLQAAALASDSGHGRSADFSGGDATDPMEMPDLLEGDSTDALPPLDSPTSPLEVEQEETPVAPIGEASLARGLTEAPPVVTPLAAPAPAPAPAEPVVSAPAALASPPPAEPTAAPVAPVPVAPAPPPIAEGFAVGQGSAMRAIKVLDAVPLALEAESLKFDVEGRGKTRLPFDRVDAVAAAAVSGLSAKPVLVIDFVLNWNAGPSEPLKVIRIRSDGFNPVALVGAGGAPLDAIKTLIRRVLDGAGATPLPDVGAVLGSPFSMQPDLSSYEREVLQAG